MVPSAWRPPPSRSPPRGHLSRTRDAVIPEERTRVWGPLCQDPGAGTIQTFGPLTPPSEVVGRLRGQGRGGCGPSQPVCPWAGWCVCMSACVCTHRGRGCVSSLGAAWGASVCHLCFSGTRFPGTADTPGLAPPSPSPSRALGSTWLRTELACLRGGRSHGSCSRRLGP